MVFQNRNHKIKTRQIKFNTLIKYIKYFLLFVLIIYGCMMIISLEAHGHAADVPLPTMQDLIPVPINHFDYKYSYDLFHSHDKNADGESMQEQWETSHFPLMNDYAGDFGPDVHLANSGKQCPVTVVFLDENFANLKSGDPSLFELESIATFLPDACITIQTSRCSFQNALPVAEAMNLPVEQSIYLRIFTMVEEQTHDMIERGQVRVTFLNHEKYNLKACDDFQNFSRALMNVNYWRDEFNDRDSNNVIIVRRGGVICHHFDFEKYRDFAFVAAPLANHDKIFGESDYCNTLKTLWKANLVNASVPSPLEEKNSHGKYSTVLLGGSRPHVFAWESVFVSSRENS
jgi:hypothetical protein